VFDSQIAHIKHKIELALKTTMCGVVALAAVLVAGGFFCAATFVWLQQSYGTIVACVALGGVFVLLALIALITALMLRRREPPPAKPAPKAWWNDPVTLAAALDVSRALGVRRTASIALVGAFLVGLLLSRSPRKPEQ
jgi:ethanolamine transporter EutH